MESKLVDISKTFALDIIKICSTLLDDKHCDVLAKQLLRSGTSIGANIFEGNYASSLPDFINKFQIALKECYETTYWLDLLSDTNYIAAAEFELLKNKCNKIRKLLSSSIITAKDRL
jgi:four helix bundle protein